MLPELKANRDVQRGTRRNPEKPTMIAKVCEGKGRGELWMGPLPVAQRMKVIKETDYSIQVCCFSMEPEAIKIDEKASGMRIPGAFVFRCDVFNPVTRTPDFETLQEFVITSLRQGDNVYVHCVTGIRRSVIVAALLSAVLMGITLEAAMDIINQSRNVEFNMHTGRQWNIRYESMEGLWMDEMHQKNLDREDTEFLCREVDGIRAVVHVIEDAEEAAIQSPYHLMQSHTSPLLPVDPETMPMEDQQSDFEHPLTAEGDDNPQEANPESSSSPLQISAGQATRSDTEPTLQSGH